MMVHNGRGASERLRLGSGVWAPTTPQAWVGVGQQPDGSAAGHSDTPQPAQGAALPKMLQNPSSLVPAQAAPVKHLLDTI